MKFTLVHYSVGQYTHVKVFVDHNYRNKLVMANDEWEAFRGMLEVGSDHPDIELEFMEEVLDAQTKGINP